MSMNKAQFVKEATSSVLEALGKGGGREGAGGTDNCACPNSECSEYGKPIAHVRGTPCNTMKCKKGGTALTGVGAPKGKIAK